MWRVLFFFLGLGCLLTVFPNLDLVISAQFYDETAQRFPYAVRTLDIFTDIFSASWIYLVAVILALLVFSYLFPARARGLPTQFALFYLLLVIAIGPGLLVNAVFKGGFGRARPVHIQEFGGTKQFTPALTISDQCQRNCSFTSGHAAGAFAFIAPALLARRRRNFYIGSAIAFGVVMGLARIVRGKHFLSDVVFSGVTVTIVAFGLYYLMLVRTRRSIFPDNA